MTALQVELERRMRKEKIDDAAIHETRRLIDEVSARTRDAGAASARRAARQPIGHRRVARNRAGRIAGGYGGAGVLRRRSAFACAGCCRVPSCGTRVLPGRRELAELVNAFVERQRDGAQDTGQRAVRAVVRQPAERRECQAPAGAAGWSVERTAVRRAAAVRTGTPREMLVDRFVVTRRAVAGARPAAGAAECPARRRASPSSPIPSTPRRSPTDGRRQRDG